MPDRGNSYSSFKDKNFEIGRSRKTSKSNVLKFSLHKTLQSDVRLIDVEHIQFQ